MCAGRVCGNLLAGSNVLETRATVYFFGKAREMEAWLGELEYLVLLAVGRLEGDGYGVTIRRELEERAGRSLSLGAIYSTLYRLEEKGHVSSERGEATAERGGRAKRLFRLEASGARALAETRLRLERMWEGLELKPGGGAS